MILSLFYMLFKFNKKLLPLILIVIVVAVVEVFWYSRWCRDWYRFRNFRFRGELSSVILFLV